MYTDREKADVLRQLWYTERYTPDRDTMATRVLEMIDEERRVLKRDSYICTVLTTTVICGVVLVLGWFLPGCQESEPKWTSGAPGGNLISK